MQDKVFILAVGSFNPPTYGHLGMLEDAKAYLEKQGKTVVGGIMSPVSDGYGKSTLISAKHRLSMTAAATADSTWIKASDWECKQSQWTTTLDVLKYHDKETKKTFGDDVDVVLLVGGDVIDTFAMKNPDGTPVWQVKDLVELIDLGIVVQPREGSSPKTTISLIKELANHTNKIMVIEGAVALNTVSSTRIRAAIADGRSIKYTTPDAVIEYIERHNLYK